MNSLQMMRRAALLSALSLAACQDLNVTNPNEPDRLRATQTPGDVEALIGSTFTQWWPWAHDDQPMFMLSGLADEFSSGFVDYAMADIGTEPRPAWNNSSLYARRAQTSDPWFGLYAALSSANDGLAALQRGLQIGTNGSGNSRAYAFAKLMQGVTQGQIALIFDKGPIVNESTPDAELLNPELKSSTEMMAAALTSLRLAASVADTATFTLPAAGWINGRTLTNKDVMRLANTFIARYMAYNARSAAERAAVNWTEVLARANNGITADFTVEASDPLIINDFVRIAARQRTTTPGDYARVDYMLVGWADSTAGFQGWITKPYPDRNPFQMRTKDRRIQGTTAAGSKGKYLGYHTATIYAASRGTYHRSFYYFHRFGTGESWRIGPMVGIGIAEMDLLKAEALIRLNRAGEALAFINKTRVAVGELPPVTIDGPPDQPGCVPRKISGACGSLWDALRYEKRIEGLGIDGNIAYFDARGWQTLSENTPVQFPIPGRELETLRLPLYTFGGGTNPSSAPAPQPEKCPVALPRCG